MYLDYILFAIGGTLLLISILLGVVLLLSRKRSREYRRVLHDETERIDVLETMKQSGTCSRLTTYTTETAATGETRSTNLNSSNKAHLLEFKIAPNLF